MTANFARIMDPSLREHFVYRVFAADGSLVYVGCSYNPEKRMREHKYTSRWWHLLDRVKLSGPYNYETARRLEYEAIRTEDPSHNGQNPRLVAEKRRRSQLFNTVYYAALKHGESMNDAATLARVAVDSEEAA